MSNRPVVRATMLLILLILPAVLLAGCTGNRFDHFHSPICDSVEDLCK